MQDTAAPSSSLRRPDWPERTIWSILLLVLAVGAAYFNSLNCALVWDDVPTILETQTFEHLSTVFESPPQVTTASGRPLLSLSLWLNYVIAKRSVVALHLGNVLVHAGGTLILFGFARRTALLPKMRERWGCEANGLAFFIAAIWAVHPLQTEAVTYIIQRAESMMGAFYLLTLYCFLRGATSPRRWPWLVASILACAAGMGSKEVMVSAPLIVLLFDRSYLAGSFREAFRTRKIYYVALASSWLILAYLVISLGGNRGGGTGGFSSQAAWLSYWASQFRAIAIYLKLTFFPHPLVFQYGPRWANSWQEILPYAAVVVPLVLATLYAVIRWPRVGFLSFWFFAVLAPTSIIPGTTDIIVEHRMYLALAPLIGLVVMFAYARINRLRIYFLSGAIVVLIAITARRNLDYKTPLALWEDTVAKSPAFALGHFNLAAVLQAYPDRRDEMIHHLEEAVRILPTFPRAHFNLALALSQDPERKNDAYAHYAFAVRLQPDFPEAQNNMGVMLQHEGLLPQAIEQFRAALRAKPTFISPRYNLARALAAVGDTLGAIAEYESLLKLDSKLTAAQLEYGSLLANTGRPLEAIAPLETALQQDPSLTDARYLLGLILVEVDGRTSEAIELLQQVLRERPGYAEVHFNLGNALGHFPDRYPDAIAQFEAAVKLKPDYAEAHFNLATALESFPHRSPEALHHYREYTRLRPESPDGHLRIARLLATDPLTAAEARQEAQAALRLDPGSSEARQLLEELRTGVRTP